MNWMLLKNRYIQSSLPALELRQTKSPKRQGCSMATVERYLATLKKKDLIEHRGSAKTGGYYTKQAASSQFASTTALHERNCRYSKEETYVISSPSLYDACTVTFFPEYENLYFAQISLHDDICIVDSLPLSSQEYFIPSYGAAVDALNSHPCVLRTWIRNPLRCSGQTLLSVSWHQCFVQN